LDRLFCSAEEHHACLEHTVSKRWWNFQCMD